MPRDLNDPDSWDNNQIPVLEALLRGAQGALAALPATSGSPVAAVGPVELWGRAPTNYAAGAIRLTLPDGSQVVLLAFPLRDAADETP